MLKGVVSGVALSIGIALIGVYGLVQSGMIPANADAKPGWLETWTSLTPSIYSGLRVNFFLVKR
jgi:thiosulfate dehydrogenase